MSKYKFDNIATRSDEAMRRDTRGRSRRFWLLMAASWAIGTLVYTVGARYHYFASSNSVSNAAPAISPAQNTSAAEVRTFVTREPSLGVTEANFTPETLQVLERGIVASMEKNSQTASVDLGLDPRTFEGGFESASAYVDTQGIRLAIVRVRAPGLPMSVVILGVQGPELVRVTCLREGPQEIPIWRGPCGRALKSVFNVGLEP
jgi:hypothetical protein